MLEFDHTNPADIKTSGILYINPGKVDPHVLNYLQENNIKTADYAKFPGHVASLTEGTLCYDRKSCNALIYSKIPSTIKVIDSGSVLEELRVFSLLRALVLEHSFRESKPLERLKG